MHFICRVSYLPTFRNFLKRINLRCIDQRLIYNVYALTIIYDEFDLLIKQLHICVKACNDEYISCNNSGWHVSVSIVYTSS